MQVILNTQKAVFEALTYHAPLMAVVEGVYDHVLQKAVKPYVTIGDIVANLDRSPSYEDYNVELELNVYAENFGRKKVLEIADMVHDVLHKAALDIEGFEHINCYFSSIDTQMDASGQVYRANMVFEMLVRKTTG